MPKAYTNTVTNERERSQLVRYLGEREMPYTVTVKSGVAPRSARQNRLQFQWFNDMYLQGDQSIQDYRAECKLNIGVPILCAASDEYREQFEVSIKQLPYATQLLLMKAPADFQVTSLMSVKQKCEYLDEIWRRYTAEGFRLTDPSLMGLESYEGCVRV